MFPEAPRLYAADLSLGVVVMGDVSGMTLESILTGNDPSAALIAAQMWGRATATVMAASMREMSDRAARDEVIPAFQDTIRRLDPQTRSAGGPASPRLPGRGLEKMCAALETEVPDDAELDLFESLRGAEEPRSSPKQTRVQAMCSSPKITPDSSTTRPPPFTTRRSTSSIW